MWPGDTLAPQWVLGHCAAAGAIRPRFGGVVSRLSVVLCTARAAIPYRHDWGTPVGQVGTICDGGYVAVAKTVVPKSTSVRTCTAVHHRQIASTAKSSAYSR